MSKIEFNPYNFDWPSDDGSFHQQEWDETEDFDYNYGGGNDADADEEVHDVNADYEAADTENNDMAELEVSFSESKIDYQTMDKNPTNFIPKEEDFNFVKDDNNAESSEEDNSDEEINYDCPSDDECHEYHQQESDDEYFGDYEHKEDEDIDYCDEDDSADLEELEITFAGSTIDDQKMDQDLANIIAKEEELNFVEGGNYEYAIEKGSEYEVDGEASMDGNQASVVQKGFAEDEYDIQDYGGDYEYEAPEIDEGSEHEVDGEASMDQTSAVAGGGNENFMIEDPSESQRYQTPKKEDADYEELSDVVSDGESALCDYF
ncbi:hypothetical protein DAPPUDRAFT_111403 [Daphnia pulex]|uniref:Uncharacterized protein n=1 Tax=Daphnia pulex TaxID=6669 RepID=E9H920_DAPPU|nr:hypothetical protein DAPPUDRAFT_111403 [Daphnia pulex]|eukprot:EFX71710.1 hypothetical protein DAPPUDRAFT_111403 [Daphnia pulex]